MSPHPPFSSLSMSRVGFAARARAKPLRRTLPCVALMRREPAWLRGIGTAHPTANQVVGSL
jgi:hypothetical protein